MTLREMGRLALRDEGEFWVAYYAKPNTMDGAIKLGSIRLHLIKENEELRSEFMTMMKNTVSASIETITGKSAIWTNERIAPGHERKQ